MPARRATALSRLAAVSSLLFVTAPPARAGDLAFDRIVIDADFPNAYQVEVADVNGDGKPDVVAVGGGTCAWYENPSWKKRVVTGPKQTPGIISSATRDLDGDGKAEIAVAYEFSMNDPTKGKLLLARQTGDGWACTPVADVGSIHRLRWGTFVDPAQFKVTAGSVTIVKRPGLVVAPIFGTSAKPPLFQEEPAQIALYMPGPAPKLTPWERYPGGTARVCHAIDVLDRKGDQIPPILAQLNPKILLASNAGVSIDGRIIVQGAPGEAPKKGCSEVHLGTLKNGDAFVTTVEPWHGTEVAVYFFGPLSRMGPRNVIDATLKDGHALWVADFDGDGDDEILAGYRGPGTSVLAFDFNGKTWDRTVVDDKIAAQDLRGGDLDSDGRPDAVAVGGSTKNVVWYRPKPKR